MSYERAAIARMQGYSWGEQPEDPRTIKLNTNENPYPPSPAVGQALAAFDPQQLRRYPNPTASKFRNLAAAHFGLQPAQVLATNGGDELLRLAFTTFLAPGQPFAMASPSYSLYPVLAAVAEAPVLEIPLDTAWQLPNDFAAQLNAANVGLCCLVNPHAPSGTLLPQSSLAAIAKVFRGVLLVDEAYVDFVDPALAQDSTQLVRDHDNVLLLRTLSKGYSLAGLRFGFGLAQTNLITPMLTKTRDSYNLNAISQVLAEAAFQDQAHASRSWQLVREQRQLLAAALATLGFRMPPSQANFLLAQVPAAGPNAAQLYQGLKQQGILVRYFPTPGLDDKLRISVGSAEENQALLQALRTLLA